MHIKNCKKTIKINLQSFQYDSFLKAIEKRVNTLQIHSFERSFNPFIFTLIKARVQRAKRLQRKNISIYLPNNTMYRELVDGLHF